MKVIEDEIKKRKEEKGTEKKYKITSKKGKEKKKTRKPTNSCSNPSKTEPRPIRVSGLFIVVVIICVK